MEYSSDAIGKVFKCAANYKYLIVGKVFGSVSTIFLKVPLGAVYKVGQGYLFQPANFQKLQEIENCKSCLCLGSFGNYLETFDGRYFICKECRS